jgi:ATP-dependent helicase/nuclease subunit B
MTRPALFTIPAGTSFVDALARGLLERHGGDPLALGRVRVLLPTRRAARTLREAFLRLSGGEALILPSMQPLGDVDEGELGIAGSAGDGATALDLPPAIPPLERTLLLSRLVLAWRRARGETADDPAQAFRLAVELAGFIDQVHTEGCDLSALHGLVPEEFASHWQITIEFLRIVAERWPEILAERGYLDPAARRDRLLRLLARRWSDRPPPFPVVAAGSTGSIPATAGLIGVVARLPQGAVVLPGFDTALDPTSWDALDASHPQYGMKQLLARIAVDRAEVEPWAGTEQPRPERVRLLHEAMRPASTTAAWQEVREGIDAGAALDGLWRIDAPTQQDEAGAVAAILRETLESPSRTAALITPDRDLARRVAAALRRWGVEIDDSAGTPLALTPVATFLRLTADMALSEAAPVPLLAALKHPLAAGGEAPGRFRAAVRRLERAVLRGPRPALGLDGVAAALAALDPPEPTLTEWWRGVAVRAAPFMEAVAARDADLAATVRAHVAFAEALAATDHAPGAERLWVEAAGEAAAAFLDEFVHTAGDLPLDGRHYPALLEAAMADRVVRPAFGRHPRVAILGPLEARLHHADVTVLGGLNEGTWPPDAGTDPWMSRPMKQRFGLPAPERRIGLSAHDFVQGASAPLVYLTRADKVGGTPTLPSRWLLRLDALVGEDRWPRPPHLAWHLALDAPDGPPAPLPPPEPTPPVAVRPRALSVTRVEAWLRDPYGLYAERILRLRPLDPLDADPCAADRGTIIHEALYRYLMENPVPPPDAYERLRRHGLEVFRPLLARPLVRAFWWPRFERIARWFVERQTERQAEGIVPVLLERRGELTLRGFDGGDFVLSAKADRIDRRADGFEIIDYKTGGAPKAEQLLAGYAAQMPLQALMLRGGAFEGAAGPAADLAWWTLKGEANEIRLASAVLAGAASLDELVEEAEAGLRRLIAAFDRPETPYVSHPNPLEAGFGEYDHLARVKEWAE